MRASIITIGDELLIGQTVDTNSAWMGSELSKLGFDVHKMTSIHDRREDILAALAEAEENSDVVLITGGLGPTSDDITKQTLCEYFNTKLVLNERVLEMVTEMMTRRNFQMNENNRRQAEVPELCRVLENESGTAPGMWFEKNKTVFVSMPGVPNEMKHLMNVHVIPELKKHYVSQAIIHKNIMTYGMPEAKLAELLFNFESDLPREIKLAYLPSEGIIKLRLTATGKNRQALETTIHEQVEKLYKIVPDVIFAEDEESLEIVIGRLLKEKNSTLCTAESCTGGQIANKITSVAGSSQWYVGSVVAYANNIKTKLLDVPDEIINRHGAVSREVVTLMATGSRKLFGADYSVATSGIAGPDGGTSEKPVGTIWIAVSSSKGVTAEKYTYSTDRIYNIKRFSVAALNLLRKQILTE